MVEVYTSNMKRNIAKYNKAHILRQNGKSIRFIAHQLHISTSTASTWCRDIILSSDQLNELASKGQKVFLLKRFAEERHEQKVKDDLNIFKQAKSEIRKLKKQEFFMAGLALY